MNCVSINDKNDLIRDYLVGEVIVFRVHLLWTALKVTEFLFAAPLHPAEAGLVSRRRVAGVGLVMAYQDGVDVSNRWGHEQ